MPFIPLTKIWALLNLNQANKINHKMKKFFFFSFLLEELKIIPALGIDAPNPNLAIIQRSFLLRQLLSVHSQLQPAKTPHKAHSLRMEERERRKTLESSAFLLQFQNEKGETTRAREDYPVLCIPPYHMSLFQIFYHFFSFP